MNEYLTSPVTPIVASVLAVSAIIAIFIKVASSRSKERARMEARERARMEARRVRAQEVIDQQERLEAKRSRVVRGLSRTSDSVRRKDTSVRRPSTYRPSAPVRRSDDSSTYYDPTAIMLTTGLLYSDPTPSDSGSSSNDSGFSSDSGSSSSYDSGSSSSDSGSSSSDSGSFGGGDSGSF